MFEEVQKRQRRQLGGLGWVMVLFGGAVSAISVCALVLPHLFGLSTTTAVRGLLGALVIFVLGLVSIYRARQR